MEFTTTEKGSRKLIRNGYMYVFQKNLANDLTSWECILRRRGQCKEKVKLTLTDNFVEEVNVHTHPPSQPQVEVAQVKASIKRKTETTNDTCQQILGSELQNISQSAAVNLPQLNSIRRNIRAQRQDRNVLPTPLRRQDIPVLPQQYQVTAAGDQFLLFDSGVGDAERIFIFATQQGLRLLANYDHWFMDGTFKLCPEVFYQIYTIHAQVNDQILPCIFGLLPSKTEMIYNRFFIEVCNAVRNLGHDPVDILVDFERAAINAIQTQIPGAHAYGCFYHLCSNIWKHIQEAGLQAHYVADDEFSIHLRMIAALAFVPPNDVADSFDELCAAIRNLYNIEADNVLDYFEDHYIGRFRRNAPRRPPTFAIELWNMFHRSDAELPRTNNAVEGWHRCFQANVSACHPIFWKFLEVLKKEESVVRVSIFQNLGGHQPPSQRRRYADCNQRILRILDDYPNRQRMDYLRSIAHNLSF